MRQYGLSPRLSRYIRLHRRIEAQQLLHRPRDEAGIGSQPFELAGTAKEREDAVADEVGGGLVSGDEEQAKQVQHLAPAQALAPVLGLREGAQEVVARGLAPLLDDRAEIGVEGCRGGIAEPAFAHADGGFEQARAPGRPVLESGPVFGRHAEHLGDDDDGQGLGKGRHEVEGGGIADVVEQRAHDGADAGLERGDRLAGEGAVQQRPQPRVVGGARNSSVNWSGGGRSLRWRGESVPLRGSLEKRRWSRRMLGEDGIGIVDAGSGPALDVWGWPIRASSAERAVLEALDELPGDASFENLDKVFEGLTTLRPGQLMALLAACRSVKVRRLFFVFADRHGHGWRKHLDSSRVDFGSRPRALAPGGRLHPAYRIYVPEELLPGKAAGARGDA